MINYEHTQPGILMRRVFGVATVVAAAAATALGAEGLGRTIPASVAGLTALCFVAFYSLTVRIDAEQLSVSFGPGWIKKRFRLHDVVAARTVQNRWYYGWGVKLTPHGWLFNVSGFDAVEIELANGRRYRIGSDQPDELLAAMQSAGVGVQTSP